MKNTIIENFDNFDSSYRDIYSYVMNETDNLNLETGVIEFENMADANMAQSILKDAYPNVEISTSDDEDKPGYVVFFSYSVEEDLDKFLANKNPEGTPVANPSFGESLEGDMNLLERYYSDFDDYLDDSNTEPEDDALWNDEEFDEFHDSEDYPVGRKDVYPWTWVKVNGEFVRMGDDGHIYSSKEAEQIYNKKHSSTKESLDESTNTYDRVVGDHLITFNINKLPFGYRVTGAQYNGSYVASKEFETREEAVKYIKGIGEPYIKKSKKDSFTVEDIKRFLDKNKINQNGASYERAGDELRIHFSGDRGYADARLACKALQEAGYDARRTSSIGVWVYIKGLNENDTNESVEKHDTLNQKIFNGDELDPVVKDKLLEIVDNFKSALEQDGIDLDIKDVRIIGSNASYNYTAQSDIDLHIFADLSVYPDQEELVEKIYNAYKTLWNNKYDPTIYGHEVEIYVEPYDGE